MKVQERDGRIQDFVLSKILITIERISDEAKAPFTASDIKNLGNMIEKTVMERETDIIPIDDIQNIITFTLMKNGFNIVAKYYNNTKETT